MKSKTSLVLMLLLIAIRSFAQQGDGGRWNVCRLDSIYTYSWDTTLQSWQPQSKILRTHDSDRYLTYSTVQRWNISDYDAVSQIDSFFYDLNGNFIKDITQNWNGSAWLVSRTSISYNNNHKDTALLQRLNGSVWDNLSKSSYSFDVNGYWIGELSETWNGSQWQYSIKYTYTNNASGKPTNLLIQTWNNSQWMNLGQYIYSYDNNGYETGYIYQLWDGTQFSDKYKMTNTNNNYGFQNERLKQQWNGLSWTNYSRTIYYHYCVNNTEVEEITKTMFKVFPNPFVDKLIIEPNISYELFDLIGRNVDETNLSTLPNGTYILKTEYGATMVVKTDK